MLVTNVLNACDKLLIPVQADLLSYEGVEQMLDSFMRIKKDTDIRKYLLGMLVTMYQTNTRHSLQFTTHLKKVITILFLIHIYHIEQKQKTQ